MGLQGGVLLGMKESRLGCSGEGKGGEYVSSDGISLEMAEMASADHLDVDAGGMVSKDKGNPIAVVGGREKVRVEVREMCWTWLRTMSTTVLGNPQLRKKMD
eukprot:g40631.t1